MKRIISVLKKVYHYGWSLLGAVIGKNTASMRIIGVTGTKGKTTTVALLDHIFKTAGHKTASLSTAQIRIGDVVIPNTTGNTMPGHAFVQRWLRQARKKGCDVAIAEVTSQGVTQYRHKHIAWDDAVFLGIHPEHIESHGSFEKYRDAKKEFFTYVAKNKDNKSPHFYVYGEDEQSTLFVQAAKEHRVHEFFKRDIPASWIIPENLDGENRIDVAAARAVALRWGVLDETIQKAIETFPGVPGRMEVVAQDPIRAIVDYAHTPQSLEGLYILLNQKKKGGRLICVFGSAGGGRDIAKRSHMGLVASTHCDEIILTNEDPFDEDPMEIIEQIREGISKDFKGNVWCIIDRKEAIESAIRQARNGDTVVCTGKGSENSIRLENGKKQSWSEKEVVFNAIQKIKHTI